MSDYLILWDGDIFVSSAIVNYGEDLKFFHNYHSLPSARLPFVESIDLIVDTYTAYFQHSIALS
ncbi:hypothetical protein H6S82_15415 [Planktothrix sp. FACHB-1355]|nr:hypothetical protein [Planktothrix sp. FACHB-1355]